MPVLIPESAGYEGSVDEPQWSDLISMAGGRQYGVADAGSWRVTTGTADREVRIAPGRGFGYGVRDRSIDQASLTLPPTTSGSRWHLIVTRRDWAADQTVFDFVAGSAAKEIPERDRTPGILDDQPLALARVAAGQSQVAEIVDLRVWGGDGGSIAADELALQYLDRLGTSIRIGDSRWDRILNNLGQPTWSQLPLYTQGWIAMNLTTGRRNGGGVYPLARMRVPGGLMLRGTPTMLTGLYSIGAWVAQLPVGSRPSSTVFPPVVTGSSGTARLRVNPADGAITVDRVESGSLSTWYSLDGLFIPL